MNKFEKQVLEDAIKPFQIMRFENGSQIDSIYCTSSKRSLRGERQIENMLGMNYYDFELEVLQNLHDKLQVDTISVDRESKEVIQKRRGEDGKLHDFVLYKYHGTKLITLNFKCDFHYTISQEWLQTAFENRVDAEYVINVIINNVCEDFVNKVIKK